MSCYKELTASETAERILLYKNPTVIMHQKPDGDTAASAIALVKIFRALGVEASYACQDSVSERLSFLTAGEKREENLEQRELISIDVASPSQLGLLSEYSDKITLSIDHHAVNTPYCDNYTLPGASSAGEVLLTVLLELIKMGKCELTQDIAYPLYTAISSDTGGFVFSSCSPRTYRYAAMLAETGIDFADINHKLFFSKTRTQIAAEGFIASKIKTAAEERIAYASLSKAERDSIGALYEHFETAIDVIRSVLHAEVAIFVRENDKGEFKASLRSTGLNVASIAALFGGGGHIRAAGCAIKAESVEQALQLLLEKVEKAL